MTRPGVAVTDEDDLLELLALDEARDVVDVRLQPHLRAEQVLARPVPGQ